MGHRLVYRWEGFDLTSHQIQMMGTDMVSKTSVICNQLTWLVAQEDFIVLEPTLHMKPGATAACPASC
jgi:hypothetical protein